MLNLRTLKRMSSTFNFSHYNVVGFDLDNTLLQYNLTELFKLQYEFLCNYLTEKKNYNTSILTGHLASEDLDFIRRGLFIDCSKGNILNLRHDGFIIKASHGTIPMNDKEIENTYGKNRIWSLITKYQDKLALWHCEDTRTFLDFTDSIATLVFAKGVDSVDKRQKCETYNVWPDLLEAIIEMYKYDSIYITTITSNPYKYMDTCDKATIEWLKELKKGAKVILITGAELEVAEVTMPLCFGPQYKEVFDLIIYNAKKPGFFTMRRAFLTLNGEEADNVTYPGEYKNGNWDDTYTLFKTNSNSELKCVYVGDNPLQDIYAPANISQKLDTVAVIEEVAGEGLHPDVDDYPHTACVSSQFWGPYLDSGMTITGDILKKNAKLVIPSVKVLTSKPINYEHKSVLSHT